MPSKMSSWNTQAVNLDKSRVVRHTRIDDESAIEKTYTIGSKLGSGSFGVVKTATHLETGKKWAIKIVNKEKAGSSAVVLLEREVAILKKVNHPNIIHLEEVFETSKRMYLVMELCSQGELNSLYKEKEALPEEEAKAVIKRLAKAVSYLHKNDIVHRDIKLENILLSTNPSNPEDKLNIKLTDFGLSVVKGGVGSDSMIQSMCGTPMYMAPEVIDNQGYSQQCDVWSIGVLAYMLIGGNPPFSGRDEDSLYENIRKGELDFTTNIWKEVSTEAKNAIQGLLKVDPAHRITVHELLDHPWMTGDMSRPVNKGPTNVLEMMKQWKDELLLDDEGEAVDSNANVQKGEEKEPSVNSSQSVTSQPSNKSKGNSISVRKTNPSRSPGGRRISPTGGRSKGKQTTSSPSSKASTPRSRPHTTNPSSTQAAKTSSLKPPSKTQIHVRQPSPRAPSTATITNSEARRKKKSGNGS
ncbi:serine/threonine-protein kinase 33-like [Apostichopus japonicus]|uniref:serine/threonine-protein kinase 33-like n=1 Tax=Stichopus japonicus TaxID=307972 RepID=UPI003AB1E34F